MLLRRIARPMLAAIFITGGINALRSPQGHAEIAKPVLDTFSPAMDTVVDSSPLDPPSAETIVRVDAGIKIVAGSLLAFGKVPRLASAALAASLIPTTLAGHRFWEETDAATRTTQQIHFFKNVGLLGGLLIAAADTEGKPSLGWRAQKAAALAQTAAAHRAGTIAATAEGVGSTISGAAHQTSGLATGLAAGLAGAVSAQSSNVGADFSKRAAVLQKKAVKSAAAWEKAANKRVAAWEKAADKRTTAWQKKADKQRAALEKKAPLLLDQAGRFGHDLATRATAIGSEVAHQAEELAGDARKRVGALGR